MTYRSRHQPPPIPPRRESVHEVREHRSSSQWPMIRRWFEGIMLPVVTAAFIAGVVTLINLRQDVAVISVRLSAIEDWQLHHSKR